MPVPFALAFDGALVARCFAFESAVDPLSPTVNVKAPSLSWWQQPRWQLGLVVLLGVCAHVATYNAPFIFDDQLAVRENTSITSLTRMGEVLWPPTTGSGVSGRPLVNLSLALNYAVGGLDPRGYHLFNIVLHALVGGLMFAVLRRLLRRALAPDCEQTANVLGLAIAALWVVHPLQTESVASAIQRTEILGGLFYLLVLGCFLRSFESSGGGRWRLGAVVACWAGMAAKETVFTAPLVVFLVDRALIAGSFRAAWRSRGGFYLGLASAWLLLALILYKMGGTRGEAAGFGAGGITWWAYFLRQWEAICTYLKLVVWPHPLIVDYGYDVILSVRAVAVQGAVLVGLAGLTLLGSVRNALWSLPAAAFFLILGPSSSVMPLAGQTAAEHRMYLPLAAVLSLLVLALWKALGSRLARPWLIAAAFCLLLASVARNETYLSKLRLWRETLHFRPGNPRAHFNAGEAAGELKLRDEAIAHYNETLRIDPRYTKAYYNLGVLLAEIPGRRLDAIRSYEGAIAVQPDFADAHNNLAVQLAAEPGRENEALAHYRTALSLKPHYAAAHSNLAALLQRSPGREAEALAHAEEAARLDPGQSDIELVLANALAATPGRAAEAVARLRELVRRWPENAEARVNLALLLAADPGRAAEVLALFEEVLRLNPRHVNALYNYALILAQTPGRQAEASARYEAVLTLQPDHAAAHNNLGQLLLGQRGRESEARDHFAAAVRFSPNTAIYRYNLGAAFSLWPESREAARREFAAALQLDPNFSAAADALRRLAPAP